MVGLDGGESFFRQFGVTQGEKIEESFDIVRSSVIGTWRDNERVLMVTLSGGVGVLMADDANARGLAVPEMPEGAQRRMLELAGTNGDYGSRVSFQGSIGRNPALTHL